MNYRVSLRQREILLQFLERFPPLALGIMRGKEDYEKSRLMWDKIARQLNKADPRVVKSGKNWCRYWSDLKFKIRRKYANIQDCERLGKPVPELSLFDERIRNLLSDSDGNLLNPGPDKFTIYQKKFVNVDEMKDEEANERDASTNSNEDVNVESVDQCITIDYDEDGEEMIMPTEYITFEENHIIPDKQSPNTKSEPSKKTSKSTEDIKKELLAFQLQKQKELFLIEKEHRLQRHKLEMEILYLRKETMEKQLKRIWK